MKRCEFYLAFIIKNMVYCNLSGNKLSNQCFGALDSCGGSWNLVNVEKCSTREDLFLRIRSGGQLLQNRREEVQKISEAIVLPAQWCTFWNSGNFDYFFFLIIGKGIKFSLSFLFFICLFGYFSRTFVLKYWFESLFAVELYLILLLRWCQKSTPFYIFGILTKIKIVGIFHCLLKTTELVLLSIDMFFKIFEKDMFFSKFIWN